MTLRALLRRAIATTLLVRPDKLSGVSVLMYHSISPGGPGFITDSVAGFERNLSSICKRGLQTVFASEVPALLDSNARAVCVTLDDGYQDNYEHAFPILKEYGVKATIFLATSFIGGTRTGSKSGARPMLSESQIREMQESGLVEFMPHTHTHPHLTTLSAVQIEEEILTSKRIVEGFSSKPASVFAYPYGELNEETRGILKRLGFTAAFGTAPGIARTAFDRFDLPRNALGDISDAEFTVKTSDRLDSYLALKHLV